MQPIIFKCKRCTSIFLLCTLLACTHKDPVKARVQFTGVVVDYFSRTPYPGTRVVLHLGTALDPFDAFSFKNERKDSVSTDNAGKYVFSVDREDDVLYRVVPVKPGYLQATIPPGTLGRLITSGQMTDTVFLGASASANLVIRNDNPGDSDQVSVEIYYGEPGHPLVQRYGLSTSIIKNMGLDPNDFTATYNFFYDINPTIRVYRSVTRYGTGSPVTTTRSDTIPLSRQDTALIRIDY